LTSRLLLIVENLSEKNFNDKVLIAISRTKDRVQADVKNNDIITYANRSKKTKFISDGQLNLKKKYSGTSDWERRRLDLTMGSKYGSIGSTSALEQIDNKKLDNYIKHALDEQGIELEYDYGIFSNKQNNFLIINGNFAVSVGDEQASNIESNKSLYDSDYKIPMFENSNIIPGYLKLYFPEKGNKTEVNMIEVINQAATHTRLLVASREGIVRTHLRSTSPT